MQAGTRRGVVLVAVLLASVLTVGLATGSAPSTTRTVADRVQQGERQPAIDPGQYDAHSDIDVTQEYRLTPGEPGRIDVQWHFEMPSNVASIRTQLPVDATNVRTERLSRVEPGEFFGRERGGIYEWTDDDPQTATITFTRPANVTGQATGPEGGSGTLQFVDTGDWALIRRHPTAPVGYSYFGNPAPALSYQNRTAGQGTVGSRLVFLGEQQTYERSANGQTFRLVVPAAATLAEDRSDVLDSVTAASERLRIGDRDQNVLMIAAPSSVSWAVRGLQTGPRGFYVVADEPLDTPRNAWLHEYLHSRQNLNRSEATRWFTEGSAQYYAALLTLQQERIQFQTFREYLDRGAWPQFNDVRLARPATWQSNSGNYYKGALVAGNVDRQIRLATEGRATLQDVFRRMNAAQSPVTQSDFLGYVRQASDGAVVDRARRYTETTATPDVWSRSDHQDAFGTLPASFSYELPTTESGGLGVDGPYRTGRLNESRLVTNETLRLDVNVTNVGGQPGQYDLKVTVNGTSVANRTGQLDAGQSRTELVEHTFTSPGIYRVSVGQHTQFVRVQAPARPAVTELSANRTQLRAGGRVELAATVDNDADRPGTRRVTLARNGTEIDSGQVHLGAGQSTDVTATVTLSEAGTYRFDAGNRSVTVTAEAPETPTATETATGTATDPSGSQATAGSDAGVSESETGTPGSAQTPGATGPGFGVLAALLALGALLVARQRVQ